MADNRTGVARLDVPDVCHREELLRSRKEWSDRLSGTCFHEARNRPFPAARRTCRSALTPAKEARTFLAVISQSVACNQHHDIEQSLGRLLLTLNKYAGARGFQMLQESIAALLGVRRAGISEAAGKLQAQGLMRYQRGRISNVDGRRLQRKSCECYRVIRQQYAQFQDMLPLLLSGK